MTAARRPGPVRAAAQEEASADAERAILDAADVQRALTRIAHEILERTKGGHDVVLLGIPTRGNTLARRLAARIAEVADHPIPVGSLDVTMYRDDLRMGPARALGRTEIPGEDRRPGCRLGRRRPVFRPYGPRGS